MSIVECGVCGVLGCGVGVGGCGSGWDSRPKADVTNPHPTGKKIQQPRSPQHHAFGARLPDCLAAWLPGSDDCRPTLRSAAASAESLTSFRGAGFSQCCCNLALHKMLSKLSLSKKPAQGQNETAED